MSKIKLFALGGLNENGKNMYVANVDDEIFVFDAGLKYAEEKMLGIDYIIPKIDYLVQNKEKIKGIFLTHGHDENIGSISDIIDLLPNIKIYGSKFTIEILTNELKEDNKDINNLVVLEPHRALSLGKCKIFPVSLSHSIPGNFGYALYTNDGVIFYASDFVFDSTMRDAYQTDIGKLAYIGKQGVLCLLTESIYAAKKGHTSPNHRITSLIRETLNHTDGRIIYNVLSSQLYRIQELFTEVSKTDRKIVIMGKRLQNLVNQAIESGYLTVRKDLIGDLSDLNKENSIIVISNEREKPYFNMIKIVNGYDKYIKLTPDDTVFIATPVYEGREKTFYDLLDDIAKIGANISILDNKKNLSHHASSEDLMMMIDLMNPKYYMPVKGEYRYQYENAELASNLGIPKENILLKQNGDVITFKDGTLKDDFEIIPTGEVYIDGSFNDGVEELVLKDRELLRDNGIVVVSTTINKKTKKIVCGPEILSRGFIYVKDNTDLINEMGNICTKIITDNTVNNYIEYNKIKTLIRDELGKFIYKETECKPMILVVIQEI